MKLMFHRALTLLLSAAVLVGSLLPPAVSHAHEEGDRPHSHGSEAIVHDDHGRSHSGETEEHHHGDHSEMDRGESTAPFLVVEIEKSSAHLHFILAGIDFSIPLPHRGDSDDPLTPYDDGKLECIRLATDVVIASRVGRSDLVDTAAARSVFLDRYDAALSLAARTGVRAVDRMLLCGGARCERSVVLLI